MAKNSNFSSKPIRWRFLLFLMFAAFFVGRLGKYYYQQNRVWLHQVFAELFPSPIEKTSPSSNPSQTLFILLKINSSTPEMLPQKIFQESALESLSILTHHPNSLQVSLWIYQAPSSIKTPPHSPVTPLIPLSSTPQFISSLKTLQKDWPSSPKYSLKNLLDSFRDHPPNPLPHHLLLITDTLFPGEETLPFESIEFQIRFPKIPISVLKWGEKKANEDLILFQFANETGGNFQRATTPEELQLIFQQWIQRFFLQNKK